MHDRLLKLALAEVGTAEVGGNNRGPRIREYQSATDLPPGAWPWCAAWTCWCIREWLKDPEVVEWLNLQYNTPDQWRPRTALAFGLMPWARSRPRTVQILSDTDIPKPGDIVVYDFSHCGIVINSGNRINFNAIEGNTNEKGARDSLTGDGVFIKTRRNTLVRCFLRIQPGKVN